MWFQFNLLFFFSFFLITSCLSKSKALNKKDEKKITKRTSNIIIGGTTYDTCGLYCKLEKISNNIPPVLVKVNRNYLPVDPLPLMPDYSMSLPTSFPADLHTFDNDKSYQNSVEPLSALDDNQNQIYSLNSKHTSYSSDPENEKLKKLERFFAHHENHFPVTIEEENFPLPEPFPNEIDSSNKNSEPLFISRKKNSNNVQITSPLVDLDEGKMSELKYNYYNNEPSMKFRRPSYVQNSLHESYNSDKYSFPPFDLSSPYKYKYSKKSLMNDYSKPISPKTKPNIEVLRINHQDHESYPLPPPPHLSYQANLDNNNEELMNDGHSKIKPPYIHYMNPDPHQGSITYDDENQSTIPPPSKIDENSIVSLGQNYGKMKNIKEQLNTIKRQYLTNYHEHNPDDYSNFKPIRIPSRIHRPINFPIYPLMNQGQNKRDPSMEFNGFYSNYPAYHQPPSPPPNK